MKKSDYEKTIELKAEIQDAETWIGAYHEILASTENKLWVFIENCDHKLPNGRTAKKIDEYSICGRKMI